MTYKQTIKTKGNKKITFELPNEFINVDEIIITINDKKDSEKMLNEIEASMNDPDFISDMNEVMDDYKSIDAELK